MKIKKSLVLAAVAAALTMGTLPAQAAKPINVLVVDSGSDFTHNVLNPLANPIKAELNGKSMVDDDNNGFVDDIYGWNFVENNNTLVNLQDTPPEYDRVCGYAIGSDSPDHSAKPWYSPRWLLHISSD